MNKNTLKMSLRTLIVLATLALVARALLPQKTRRPILVQLTE